ncbi:hypothetical protein VPH35_130915 [Triticum aestivum]
MPFSMCVGRSGEEREGIRRLPATSAAPSSLPRLPPRTVACLLSAASSTPHRPSPPCAVCPRRGPGRRAPCPCRPARACAAYRDGLLNTLLANTGNDWEEEEDVGGGVASESVRIGSGRGWVIVAWTRRLWPRPPRSLAFRTEARASPEYL